MVTGESGSIVHGPGWEVDGSASVPGGAHAVRLSGGGAPSVRVGDHECAVPNLPALLRAPVPDGTTFNALKTCGLISVLSSLSGPPPEYDYRQALYDHLMTGWLRYMPGAVDPLALFHHNFVSSLDRAVTLAA